MWLIDEQRLLKQDPKFAQLKVQLALFTDEYGVAHSKGRLSNADLHYTAKYPALLPREHYFTKLVVKGCHERVNHCGVKDTLAELRTQFWVVRGRQFVKSTLTRCIVCKRLEGKSYHESVITDLPAFRVQEGSAFSKVGVDYCGPLFIKSGKGEERSKVWISAFSYNSSRAIHLELVIDLTVEGFLRCFQRFSARRGLPRLVTRDNASTFKAASKILLKMIKSSKVQAYFASKNITWKFLLEKAP